MQEIKPSPGENIKIVRNSRLPGQSSSICHKSYMYGVLYMSICHTSCLTLTVSQALYKLIFSKLINDENSL